ncbi:hypothetical protein GGD56_006727 [Rhizobium mongolense]|uniref:Uncharacterized protein n=2 Tax=Rhizobium mongolense TaxID=57676 RepID=A0ABR6IYI5_9HYPH|nr:hypothetical protein [Rhizobium mongolense]TVZ72751.1 hypothetical protein BCL32_0935 [Rhizobium mongolense USDA 1844]
MNRRPTLTFGTAVAAILTVCGGSAFGQHTNVILLTPDRLVWQDDQGLPNGAQIAVLVGDPSKAGDTVVLRAKFPPNYQVPPHTHPHAILSDREGSLTSTRLTIRTRSEMRVNRLTSLRTYQVG